MESEEIQLAGDGKISFLGNPEGHSGDTSSSVKTDWVLFFTH